LKETAIVVVTQRWDGEREGAKRRKGKDEVLRLFGEAGRTGINTHESDLLTQVLIGS
jgi:replicative superfamily II helicase